MRDGDDSDTIKVPRAGFCCLQLPCSASLAYRNFSASLGINVDGPPGR